MLGGTVPRTGRRWDDAQSEDFCIIVLSPLTVPPANVSLCSGISFQKRSVLLNQTYDGRENPYRETGAEI
jgi:hypothetical protein